MPRPSDMPKKVKKVKKTNHGKTVSAVARTGAGGKAVSAVARKKK